MKVHAGPRIFFFKLNELALALKMLQRHIKNCKISLLVMYTLSDIFQFVFIHLNELIIFFYLTYICKDLYVFH